MSDQARIDYQIRLGATVDCVWFLLQQGLPFRGHDETKDSINQGNFLELLSGYATIIKILKPFLWELLLKTSNWLHVLMCWDM